MLTYQKFVAGQTALWGKIFQLGWRDVGDRGHCQAKRKRRDDQQGYQPVDRDCRVVVALHALVAGKAL